MLSISKWSITLVIITINKEVSPSPPLHGVVRFPARFLQVHDFASCVRDTLILVFMFLDSKN